MLVKMVMSIGSIKLLGAKLDVSEVGGGCGTTSGATRSVTTFNAFDANLQTVRTHASRPHPKV
ncbi:hypothetical protein D9M68_846530 [compost metagenome]